ncbi:hypothetical protein JVU11DRAFT_1832 [Chiua virens]|nr:hypothetical protein JVU11DRAFT_1832 [Chiua virens]
MQASVIILRWYTYVYPPLVYTYLVTYWGVPSFLETIAWSLVVSGVFSSPVAIDLLYDSGRGHLQFVNYTLGSMLPGDAYLYTNKSWILVGIASIFVAAQFLVAIIFSGKTIRLTEFSQLGSVRALSKSINGTTAAGDTVIALILCVLLQRSRTGFQKSNTLINKLIIFSVNTGLLTSVFALASLISISVWPNAFVYTTFYFCMGRLYCNTLLATLNARKILRGEGLDDMALTSTSGQKTTSSRLATRSGHIPNNISIMVDTTRECTHDERYSPTCDVKTSVV